MNQVLAYAAAGLVALWGVAHAVPTRQVLAGFDPITLDNRRVVLQEWLAEALTMWGLAAAVIAATLVGGAGSPATVAVYRVAAGLLVALALLTGVDRGANAGGVVQDLPGAAHHLGRAAAGGQRLVKRDQGDPTTWDTGGPHPGVAPVDVGVIAGDDPRAHAK